MCALEGHSTTVSFMILPGTVDFEVSHSIAMDNRAGLSFLSSLYYGDRATHMRVCYGYYFTFHDPSSVSVVNTSFVAALGRIPLGAVHQVGSSLELSLGEAGYTSLGHSYGVDGCSTRMSGGM